MESEIEQLLHKQLQVPSVETLELWWLTVVELETHLTNDQLQYLPTLKKDFILLKIMSQSLVVSL